MKIQIYDLYPRDDPRLLADALRQLYRNPVAIDALLPEDGAFIIVAKARLLLKKVVVGALSYRYEKPGLKVINIGTIKPGLGIGTALMNHIEQYVAGAGLWKPTGHTIWLKATPTAVGFYDKLGFKAVSALSDGRIVMER